MKLFGETAIGFCPECQATVRPMSPPWCVTCGLPFAGAGAPAGGTCGRCQLSPPVFDQARSFAVYEGATAFSIRAYKYHRRHELAFALAAMVLAAEEFSSYSIHADFIAPVPLHSKRLRARGFNQAAVLARAVAGRRGLRVDYGTLVRVVDTTPQYGLSVAQRRENVRGAFAVRRPERVAGKSVILVDDVMTTGATLAECARTLKRCGVRAVYALTAARSI